MSEINKYSNRIIEIVEKIKGRRIVSSRNKTFIQFLDNFITATRKQFPLRIYKITIVFPNENNLQSWMHVSKRIKRRKKIKKTLTSAQLPLAYLITGIEMYRAFIT